MRESTSSGSCWREPGLCARQSILVSNEADARLKGAVMARRRRVRGKKENAQRLHAGLRAGVRYGVTLSPYDNERLAEQIQQRDRVEFLERQSKRVTVWLVEYEGKEIPVVYDKQRKTIVTVLPPEYLADIRRARQRAEDASDES